MTEDEQIQGHKAGHPPIPDIKTRKPEPAMGPDEEGEVPLKPKQLPKDRAAWHSGARKG